jgi:cytochrome c oxidase subunit III
MSDHHHAAHVASLPSLVTGSRSTGWWAIVFVVMIELVVFGGLIVSYFYLYTSAPQWPPMGTDPPKLLLPSINTAVLLISAGVVIWSDRQLERDAIGRFKVGQLVAMALLVVFLVIKYIEYSGLPYQWDTHAYGSIVWMTTGFHTAHVITVLIKTAAITVLASTGFWNSRRRSAVQGATLYWMFVALIWLPIFATLYLFPRAL